MLHGWENFFYLIGSAAGALIGLIFVVITLTAGHEPRQVERGSPVYLAPIVFHLAMVLTISAVAEVPGLGSAVLALIVGICALTGMGYAALTTVRLFRRDWEDTMHPVFSDKCFYGLIPTMIYVGLLLLSLTIWIDSGKIAYGLGATMLLLLLLSIRNAWDLANSISQTTPRRKD